MPQQTVLVVEDDDAIQDILRFLFEDEGYTVRLAHDGQEALGIIATLPFPSVILLDLRMPRLDGEGVLRDLAAHPNKRDRHPIYLLTANMQDLSPVLVQLLGSQGVPVLPKPFDIEHLRREARGAFDRLADQQH